MEKTRIDKWLWSVRLFKTRTLATDACKNGKVRVNDILIKPSFLIQIGNKIEVKKDGFTLLFEVVKIIEKRVGAPIAEKCYINQTTELELNKYKDWFIGKSPVEQREKGAGRPTKKERRVIENFKEEYFIEEEDIKGGK
jgi:ribosome-associated heat shock protein Hsp15